MEEDKGSNVLNGEVSKTPLEMEAKIGLMTEKPVEEKEDQEDVKEQIVNAIGGFGKWQLIKCVYITAIIWMPASFHLLNMVFYRAPTDFWCSPIEGVEIASEDWRFLSSPEGKGCEMYDLNWVEMLESYDGTIESVNGSKKYQDAIVNAELKKCSSFEYDRSFWKRTIVQDFDLICEDQHKQKWTQQVTFFGLLCGVFASGVISDRIGRHKTIMIMLTLAIICGTLTSFSPSYEVFLFGIWCCNFCTIGFGTVMYCWMMEILSGKEKTIFGCTPHLNYAFWGFIVAMIAYVLPDWHKMELVFSIPLIILYATYWILPESPRWLLTHGRVPEAEDILKKIAKFNGKPTDFTLYSPPDHDPNGHSIWTFFKLFKTPHMRMKTLIVYYLWFATSLIYYGLTLNSNNIGGSLFTIYAFGKAMEFPAIILVIFLLLRAGRRLTLLILYLICGLALLLTMAVSKGQYHNDWPLVTLNIIGRASSTGTLCLCYVYSAEVFPTVIRNVGIGSSSVWARVGPMLAPYIASLGGSDTRIPLVTFGIIALFAGFLVSFLPETADHKLPDTLAEGETLGRGDTLWASLCHKKKRDMDGSTAENDS